jgi:hypothetical protein
MCPSTTMLCAAVVLPGATLLSFLVALAHFTTETLVFKTMTWKGAASPAIVAGEQLCTAPHAEYSVRPQLSCQQLPAATA